MITFERIKELAKKQGKSLNKVEEDLGYGKNVLYRLKNSNPSTERLQEIADYFDVSVDYLLGREEKETLNMWIYQKTILFFLLMEKKYLRRQCVKRLQLLKL